MSEKYIDLAELITDEIGGYQTEHSVTLNWLDRLAAEHPDQVPGRTVTAGEVGRHAHLVRSIPIAGQVETPTIIDFLEALGITVIPDPEPTNAERLAEAISEIIDDHGRGIIIGRDAEVNEFAASLDRAGVRAPKAGGDDDH